MHPGLTCDLDVLSNNKTNENDLRVSGNRKTRRRILRRMRRLRKKSSKLQEENVDANTIVQIKCHHCKYEQSFPVNDGRSIWFDEPEAIAQICYLEVPREDYDSTLKAPGT